MWGDDDDEGDNRQSPPIDSKSAVVCGEHRECPHDVFPFKHVYVEDLFRNKSVAFLGDSNMRGMYKDFVKLLQSDGLLDRQDLKNKCEPMCNNDTLVYRTVKTSDTTFVEIREFGTPFHRVEYYFVTRCYNDNIETIMQEWERRKEYPDIVVMNSTLWDISRYTDEVRASRHGINTASFEMVLKGYAARLHIMMRRMRSILPAHAMTLWLTCPPISSKIVGGFLGDEVKIGDGKDGTGMRVTVMDANNAAAQAAVYNCWDVLDINFYMVPFCDAWRIEDGVHWTAPGYRHMTTLLLTFIADAMCEPLPEPTFPQYLLELTEGRGDCLEIHDPYDEEVCNTEEFVHPMQSLAPFHWAKAEAVEYIESATPPWLRDVTDLGIMPAFLVGRQRLRRIRRLMRLTGMNSSKLRRLLLFGTLDELPIEEAMRTKLRPRSPPPDMEGVKVAVVDEDGGNVDRDDGRTLFVKSQKVLRRREPYSFYKRNNDNAPFAAMEVDATPLTAKTDELADGSATCNGEAAEEERMKYVDCWIEQDPSDEMEAEETDAFEEFALKWTANLMKTFHEPNIKRLFGVDDEGAEES